MKNKRTLLIALSAVLMLFGFLMVDEDTVKRVLVKLWEISQYNVQSDDYLRTRFVVMSSPDLHENIIVAEIGFNPKGDQVCTTIYIDRDKDGVAEVVASISSSSNLIQMLTDTNGDGNYDRTSLLTFGARGEEEFLETGRFYGECEVLNIEKFQKSSWEAGVSQLADERSNRDLLGHVCIDDDCSNSIKLLGTRDSLGRPNVIAIEIVVDQFSRTWFLQ